jgi:hypothetical protein
MEKSDSLALLLEAIFDKDRLLADLRYGLGFRV